LVAALNNLDDELGAAPERERHLGRVWGGRVVKLRAKIAEAALDRGDLAASWEVFEPRPAESAEDSDEEPKHLPLLAARSALARSADSALRRRKWLHRARTIALAAWLDAIERVTHFGPPMPIFVWPNSFVTPAGLSRRGVAPSATGHRARGAVGRSRSGRSRSG
jgi:hypothetical protein